MPVPLPENSRLLTESFDAVIAVALLMHVPDQDLFETVFQIKRMLKPQGVVFLSISSGRSGIDEEGRGAGERLFRERPAEELQLLFERLGFRLTALHETPDALARGILWSSLVLQLDEAGSVRSIDQVETIIRRDRKVATYSLSGNF
jgi:SAM-dependent methyltransferase